TEILDKAGSEYPPIAANLVFFYYKDLAATQNFYENILGLERVLDYGFATIHRISSTTYLGLVDEARGMHRASEPKSVTLSFVTNEIDDWYDYLKNQNVPLRGEVKNATRHPTRGFVAYDPEGYYLEFEIFLDDPENAVLLDRLKGETSVYSPAKFSRRPQNLGILANVIWLYYRDVPAAERFFRRHLGAELCVKQAYAGVYSSSPTGFIGLVDETQGLHRYTETKAVNVAFISEQVDDWYERFLAAGLSIREDLSDSESIPVRAFVTLDPAGYYLEFNWLLDHPLNQKIRTYLGVK
ncbi:MAG: VOC family protein, partial [Candidatus Aminicenantes bacterium]|nr:VOC family protein [Candidatus Aminicenantes bacterium]